ncbi:hypothetical protein A2U01_0078746, partial [Trifolium medium]|nr:hypothetical protein [Trifolium medium]
MITGPEINLGKDSGSSELIQQIIDARQMVFVFYSDLVELT